MSNTNTHEAGVWEQGRGLVVWSQHKTMNAARTAARKYARGQKVPAGGTLSWSGGWRSIGGNDVSWVDVDGNAMNAP